MGDSAADDSKIPITVDFSGGLEILFSNQRHYALSLPAADKDGSPSTIKSLVGYLLKELIKDPRQDLFVLDGHIRPGILVLINNADWELEGEEDYELQAGDNIFFVSTLHGG
ncbi:ubiquitin-like protein [Schizothecium vesticola]|uniref:Ubiquitin-related modifier 1 n=1 Tax=Schizothecium vesticola TaxID=314040 RepID=A0AA40FC33_9PEZI|nr:ubiquitin-like protein [Schizothecium vesticola]